MPPWHHGHRGGCGLGGRRLSRGPKSHLQLHLFLRSKEMCGEVSEKPPAAREMWRGVFSMKSFRASAKQMFIALPVLWQPTAHAASSAKLSVGSSFPHGRTLPSLHAGCSKYSLQRLRNGNDLLLRRQDLQGIGIASSSEWHMRAGSIFLMVQLQHHRHDTQPTSGPSTNSSSLEELWIAAPAQVIRITNQCCKTRNQYLNQPTSKSSKWTENFVGSGVTEFGMVTIHNCQGFAILNCRFLSAIFNS